VQPSLNRPSNKPRPLLEPVQDLKQLLVRYQFSRLAEVNVLEPDDSLLVNDEYGALGYILPLKIHVVVAQDYVLPIAQEGINCIHPLGELLQGADVIVADGQYLRISTLKLSVILRALEELLNSDWCERQGEEEDHNVLLARVVTQGDVHTRVGRQGEIRRLLAYEDVLPVLSWRRAAESEAYQKPHSQHR